MSTIVVARGISLNRTRSSISWSRALVLEVAYCVGPKANMLAEFFFSAIVYLTYSAICHSSIQCYR